MSTSESSDRETKIICDGPCQKCRHQREKDVNTHGQDLLYYCRNCQSKYLCDEVLGRVSRGSSDYICPSCGSSLTEMTLERAQQLGLAFGFYVVRTQRTKRPVEEIKRAWFYYSGREVLRKDFVTDLIGYEGLEVPQLVDILHHSDLQFRPEENIEKKRILWDVFGKKPGIIRSIHNSLITRSENRKVDLIIRALTDYKALGCSYLSSIVPDYISGSVDLIGIDEETGGIVWIVVQDERIDENVINSILNEILSVPPLEFMGVDRILLLTRKWIWMGAEIARRQGRISTRWKQLNIELWEEDPLSQHRRI